MELLSDFKTHSFKPIEEHWDTKDINEEQNQVQSHYSDYRLTPTVDKSPYLGNNNIHCL
jgi:hypothetical protein